MPSKLFWILVLTLMCVCWGANNGSDDDTDSQQESYDLQEAIIRSFDTLQEAIRLSFINLAESIRVSFDHLEELVIRSLNDRSTRGDSVHVNDSGSFVEGGILYRAGGSGLQRQQSHQLVSSDHNNEINGSRPSLTTTITTVNNDIPVAIVSPQGRTRRSERLTSRVQPDYSDAMPVDDDESEDGVHSVARILSHNTSYPSGKRLFYLVDWEPTGTLTHTPSWELRTDVLPGAAEAVSEYLSVSRALGYHKYFGPYCMYGYNYRSLRSYGNENERRLRLCGVFESSQSHLQSIVSPTTYSSSHDLVTTDMTGGISEISGVSTDIVSTLLPSDDTTLLEPSETSLPSIFITLTPSLDSSSSDLSSESSLTIRSTFQSSVDVCSTVESTDNNFSIESSTSTADLVSSTYTSSESSIGGNVTVAITEVSQSTDHESSESPFADVLTMLLGEYQSTDRYDSNEGLLRYYYISCESN